MKVLGKNLSKTKPDTVMILIYAEKARVVSTEWDFSIWLCCTGKNFSFFAIHQNAQKDIDVSQKSWYSKPRTAHKQSGTNIQSNKPG